MESLLKRLPPTKALVVFEATARHMSFTRAAEELHLTQAAVSRQIRVLEQNLGVLLFSREKRTVRLTPEGQRLKRTVSMALGHIAETAVALRQIRDEPQINLHTTTAFGALWLMRRIGRFRASFPEIQLRLVSVDEDVDLAGGNVDLSISYGEGRDNWPGLDATRLLDDELFPVCSPGFEAQLPKGFSIQDLPGQPLLHLESVEPTWMSWSTAAKSSAASFPCRSGWRPSSQSATPPSTEPFSRACRWSKRASSASEKAYAARSTYVRRAHDGPGSSTCSLKGDAGKAGPSSMLCTRVGASRTGSVHSTSCPRTGNGDCSCVPATDWDGLS